MKILLDTSKRDSITPWEKRGMRYCIRRINNMTVYVWCVWYCLRKKILDIGCGKGDGLLILSYFADSVTGVDFGPKEIKYALLHHYYSPVRLIQLDLEKEWLEEKFDVITAFEILEHLEHPELLLPKIAKNCKMFIFSVPHNAPAPFHKQVYKKLDEVRALVEPYFDVDWYFERKSIIRDEVFNVPHRYIGVATPK